MECKGEEKCCLSTLNSEWHFIFTVIILEEKCGKAFAICYQRYALYVDGISILFSMFYAWTRNIWN